MSVIERPRYFQGEYLSTDDYVAGQNYQDALRRVHDRSLHTWGIAAGLEVTLGANQVTVARGIAVGSDGELVALVEPASIALPPSGEGLLVLSREAVTIASEHPDGLPRIEARAALSWSPAAAQGTLVLAALRAGPALELSVRRYSGMNVGSVAFSSPSLTSRFPSIAGWGSGSAYGLRINADAVHFHDPGGSAELLVRQGRLGAGTMSPDATLDVQAPNSPSAGPGLISSLGTAVTGSDPLISDVVAAGDTIITTNRQGQAAESDVVSVLPGGRLETKVALDVQGAGWKLQRKSIGRFSSSAGAVLVADDDAFVGIGAASPSVRLEIDGGDLLLRSGSGRLTFAGSGRIASADGAHAILFDLEGDRLALREAGTISLAPGGQTSLTLLRSGDVGLGTDAPQNRLMVEGVVYASDGYVFPDGSTQQDAGVSVPVGGIIDWWRPSISVQIPPQYRICDGSIVADPDSPFHGKAVPDLAGCFIRGCTALSDVGPGPTVSETHVHGYSVPSHDHPFPHSHPEYSGQTAGGDEGDSTTDDLASQFCLHEHVHHFSATIGQQDTPNTGPNSDAGSQENTGPGSSLPPFFGLLKLIRVR